MARRPVPKVIEQYARLLGLDARAVKAVSSVEGGLRWGAVGDQGTSFGPFQLHVGGALPRGKGSAWANSPAGVRYAMQRMANSGARGLKGRAAVNAIVRNFERPAAPGAEVAKAWGRYGSLPIERPGNSVDVPIGAFTPLARGAAAGAGQNKRQVISSWLLSKAASDDDGPSLSELAFSLQAAQQEPPTDPRPRGTSATGDGMQFSGPGNVPDPVRAGLLAERMGLHVGENPYFGGVDPVHVSGSDHYKVLGKYKGRKYGGALDVSGSPAQMAKYFHAIEKRRGTLGLKDEFYDPAGYSYDEGKRWARTIGGHSNHVHVSFFR